MLQSDNTQTDFHILRRCFGYLRPYLRMVVGIYLTMLLINSGSAVVPQLIRWGIDAGIYGGDLPLLARATLLLLGLGLLQGVVTFYQGKWSEITSQNVAYDLRNALVQKLAALSFSFHDRTEAGQILTRAMQDVERIRFLTGRAVLRIVEGAVLILLTTAILFWMNWRLALLVLLIVPPLLYRAYQYGRVFRPLSFQIQDQLGQLTTQLEQNLRGIRIVKAFAQEESEISRFEAENRQWFDLSQKSVRVQAVNAPLLDLIANVGTVGILGYGGWLVIDGALTMGELVAFMTYLGMLVRPIRNMGRIIPILAIAASAGERVFAILDAPEEVADAPGATPLPRLRGRVQFDHVFFGYQPDHPILHDITFTAEPGQVIAIMGATGSGKSTLINLIARFYEPTRGRILLDGHDSQQTTLSSLRRQIGFVMQDTLLFAASIRQNIAFGSPQASEAEIIQAAQDAQAHEFIMAMPEGYDTRVGERGVTLSGGQKQRLSIARALLTNPRLLILDDATASVDSQTEQLIQQALERLMRGRTTFIIAHRHSTIQQADLILLLESGRVTAQGKHEELLASSSLYQQIYELQTERRNSPIHPLL
ncbi:MAG: ABC transporter ATP-binding protein/permease [Anaerolineae bacterium]|nr:ABC transporter ATP-binding protein/permease [Anaerolineae bacterium]